MTYSRVCVCVYIYIYIYIYTTAVKLSQHTRIDMKIQIKLNPQKDHTIILSTLQIVFLRCFGLSQGWC